MADGEPNFFRNRTRLEIWLEETVVTRLAGRIFPVTDEIAREGARLVVRAKKHGHTAGMIDALVAATARVHGLTVATLNVKDFVRLGVDVLAL